MTDRRTPEVMHSIRWPLRLTWAGLWAERLSRAFWPLWSVALVTLAALTFGVQDALPLEAAWGGLVAAIVGAVWAVWHGLRRFHRPRRAEAVVRLDASLPGHPLSALADDQAIGSTDPASVAVWQTHRARMAARAAMAKPVRPDLRLASRDPFGLRYLALTALVMALMFGSIWRVASVSGLAPGAAEAMMNGPTWEGWAQPPLHTGKPALYLNDIAQGPLELPQGTRMQIRLYGEVGALTLSETVSGQTTPPPASDLAQSFAVMQDGAVAINGPGGRTWQIMALPDTAPSIRITGDVSRERDGKMKLPFAVEDDYGITGGTASIALDLAEVDRRYGLAIAPEPREALVIDLPLPISGNRAAFSDALIEDVSKHPFANQPVQIRLTVTDAQNQTGTADPLSIILPGKRFFDPLAAAIIELRRDLLWSRENGPRAAQIFKAITHLPDDLMRDETTFKRLMAALKQLNTTAASLTAEQRDALADELWEIALLVEEGDLASARERLARAQERLNEAIRNGADPAEIQELMEELRAATEDYMQLLAEEAQRNPDSEMAENQQRMQLTGDQIQEMMDEIQRLMEEGRMAEAAEAMAMLQKLLENLQITEGGAGGQGGPQMPGMRELQDTLRDQQQLSDEAFRELQQGPSGQQQQGDGSGSEGPEGKDLAERQQALRDRLDALNGNRLPGAGSEKGEAGRRALDEAEREMDDAERALRDGDLSGALDRQADAMDRMRDGMRALGDAQAEAERQEQGEGQAQGRGDQGPQRDPLGRETGNSGVIGSDGNMARGPDVYRRAQDLLDEIRRRAGEQQRAETERDYLKRLLELF
ncbi:DUF4175 domain-containing protein [Gemmobacter fulvus]|uniref:DUF4175 domain-containing protein n=1 Tax=Gemmobacter fulvus TaxID=2840474 RepID=UPI002796B52E|nr:DUF4175 domain-containing protein [Gemmobacter fulvus]MDQ1847180.1 DUF4175 domain-containing protein [Gemmobacter fulvus]